MGTFLHARAVGVTTDPAIFWRMTGYLVQVGLGILLLLGGRGLARFIRTLREE